MKRPIIFLILLTLGITVYAQGYTLGPQRQSRGFTMDMTHRNQNGNSNRPGSFRMSSTRQVIENGRQRSQQQSQQQSQQVEQRREMQQTDQHRGSAHTSHSVGLQTESRQSLGNRTMHDVRCDGFRMNVPRR